MAAERVIVIAPTRSTCANIRAMLSNGCIPQTLLMRERGEEIENAIASLEVKGGFGVVSGTGTGKTAALRDICRQVLDGKELRLDIVTRENEATSYTWTCNVLVITPGIAVNWLKDERISSSDLVVIDEIHQTSEHLELAMAFAKRAECKFIWMSATIDPKAYTDYLGAHCVIECSAFDPSRKAKVECFPKASDLGKFIRDRMDEIVRERRGIAVFVPTRADAEKYARDLSGVEGLHADFYHGGESAEKLRPFLTGEILRPFIIFMTIAGASSLNIQGLDTVIIVDETVREIVRGGVKCLEKHPLGANELLQMGGRVNGRAENGKIFIFSDRHLDFHSLKPEMPQFVLGGELEDLERVALICAKMGVDGRTLDLIGGIEHFAYIRAVAHLTRRGLLTADAVPLLTELGKRVERLPLKSSWGEIIDASIRENNRGLSMISIVCGSIAKLFGITRREWNQNCGVVVAGSDHLTAYNIVATALGKFGVLKDGPNGFEYRFRGDFAHGSGENRQVGEFIKWCDENGFVAREIKDIALAMRSVYRALGMTMPDPSSNFPIVIKDSPLCMKFLELLTKTQSLQFVYKEQNSSAGTVWANSLGICSARQALGTIQFFTDKKGRRRASFEGTEIPDEVLEKYASRVITGVAGMSNDGERVLMKHTASFAGEPITAMEMELSPAEVPEEYRDRLSDIFADWLSRTTTEGTAVSDVSKDNSARREKARSLNSRAGKDLFETYEYVQLASFYFKAINGARSVSEIEDIEALRLPPLDEAEVSRVMGENPDAIELCGGNVPIKYSRHYSPQATLNLEMVSSNRRRDLPNEGVFLPSGREVEIVVSFGAFTTFSSTETPQLKEKVRNHLNLKKWEAWKKPSSPEANELQKINRGEGSFPDEVQVAEYGRCALGDVSLWAYGAVSVNRWSNNSPLVFEWFREKRDAEVAMGEARKQFARFQAEVRDKLELKDAKESAEKWQKEIQFIRDLYDEFWARMPDDLCASLVKLCGDRLIFRFVSDFTDFSKLCETVIARVEQVCAELESEDKKKGATITVAPPRYSNPGDLMLAMAAGKKNK